MLFSKKVLQELVSVRVLNAGKNFHDTLKTVACIMNCFPNFSRGKILPRFCILVRCSRKAVSN